MQEGWSAPQGQNEQVARQRVVPVLTDIYFTSSGKPARLPLCGEHNIHNIRSVCTVTG